MNEEKIDGKLYDDGSARWCASCNVMHGCLYNCEKFPKDVREKLRITNFNFLNDLRSARLDTHPKLGTIHKLFKLFAGIK